MLGTFMAVLDSSIVNVALPHMMSAFGVNRDQIEWVSTAFMLATAVAMPLVGWVVNKVGYRALYTASLFLFTVGSAACAFAWSFEALIGARVLQAIGGGAIMPVGMAIVAEMFEPHERGRALGIWGTGIMAGPALGPTLGGYLTDWFGWRSIFSVNLPFGVIAVAATLMIMQSDRSTRRPAQRFDALGFAFLSVALIAGLLALANGQEKGWMSHYVLVSGGLGIIGLVMFIAVEWASPHPLLDLSLFRSRNFSLSMVLTTFRSVGLYGGVFLLPLFLERLAGYDTISTGLWMMPGALAVAAAMPIAGRLSDRFSAATLVAGGTALTAVSLFMYGWLDPQSGAGLIIGPQIVRGVGLALMMASLTTAALNSVPREAAATASSFINIATRVGGAFGLAILNAFVTKSVHRHAVTLASMLPPQSAKFAHATAGAAQITIHGGHGVGLSAAAKPSLLAAQTIMTRSQVLGYQDGFVFAAGILALGIPLSLLLKRSVSHVVAATKATGDEPPATPPAPSAPDEHPGKTAAVPRRQRRRSRAA